jgi:hypothetical protein
MCLPPLWFFTDASVYSWHKTPVKASFSPNRFSVPASPVNCAFQAIVTPKQFGADDETGSAKNSQSYGARSIAALNLAFAPGDRAALIRLAG